jgi:hypothetical protein
MRESRYTEDLLNAVSCRFFESLHDRDGRTAFVVDLSGEPMSASHAAAV